MKQWKMLYEAFVILMVITYGILLLSAEGDHPVLTQEVMDRIDLIVVLFLSAEFLIRFGRASGKIQFLRSNWFDVVSLVPISSTFRLARLIRIVRLIRLLQASSVLRSVLQSKQLHMMLAFAAIVMLWSSAGIYLLEKGANGNIDSFGDALWWSIVTTTTVGYGDISPSSPGGRIIAVFLMLTGIGMIGTVTATLANHWVDYFEKPGAESNHDRVRAELKRQAVRWVERIEELSEEEFRSLTRTMEALRGEPADTAAPAAAGADRSGKERKFDVHG